MRQVLKRVRNIIRVVRSAPGPRLFYYPDFTQGNPYQTGLYSAFSNSWCVTPGSLTDAMDQLSIKGGRVVFHLHWPNPLFKRKTGARQYQQVGVKFLRQLDAFLKNGGRFVWTVHNLYPHEDADKKFYRWFQGELFRRALVHFHSCEALAICRDEYGVMPRQYVIVPHGNYAGCYPAPVYTRQETARSLRLPEVDRVFGFLGHIRPYKGINRLLTDFGRFHARERGAHLLVMGKVSAKADLPKEDTLRTNGITLVNGFLPEARMQEYLACMDVMVFPYEDVLTSGSIMLAFTFGKPIIIPDIPALAGYRDLNAVFLYDPADPDGLLATLSRVHSLSPAVLQRGGEAARQFSAQQDWQQVAPALRKAVEACF